jgi:hypothetical protein
MNTQIFLDTKKLVIQVVTVSINMDNKYKFLIGDKLVESVYRLFDYAKKINALDINLKQRSQRVGDYLIEVEYFKNLAEIDLEVKALTVPQFSNLAQSIENLNNQAKKLKFKLDKSLSESHGGN